jgi:hypothetical protein
MTVSRYKPKKGETVFGGGSGILMPFVPASSKDSSSPSKANPTMTEEQIKAELAKAKEEGHPPSVLKYLESEMRGLGGKPEGNG